MSRAIEIPRQFNIAQWFLDRPAEAHPERIAIVGEPAAIRCGELRDLANRVGNAMRASGCVPGDRVLIVLRESAEFIAAFFGAAKIGAIPVPVNSFARAADYAFYLSDSGASIALVDESALDEISHAILESIRARLVHYKCPREIHVVEELPKTATGKMQ
ncbi:MAG: AMP-binding protein [Candidatus Acidiferrales bacterium]